MKRLLTTLGIAALLACTPAASAQATRSHSIDSSTSYTVRNSSSHTTTVVSEPSLGEVLLDFSQGVTQAATDANVQDVAIVRFQCNGGVGGSLSDNIQSMMIEAMLNSDSGIALSDRTNERYIEVENSLAGTPGDLSSANAVLIGEVFFAPGDAIGICSVRLFRVEDCRILYAGCSRVRWSEEEALLMGSTSSSPKKNSFAWMDERSIQKLKARASRMKAGFAFIQDGAQSSSNTLNKRVACAQILSTLVSNGAAAYEREFFVLAAQEQARGNSSVYDSNCKAEAVALVKPSPAVAGNYPVTLQIQSTSSRRLLESIRLNMHTEGTAGNAIGNSGENDLSSRIARLSGDIKADNPVAEYECLIPQEPMERYLEICFREFNGDTKKIKRALTVAALNGFAHPDFLQPYPRMDDVSTNYVGPWRECARILNEQYEISGKKDIEIVGVDFAHGDWAYQCKEAELLNGTREHRYRGLLKVVHTCIIEWKNGLPYKAKVKLDATPSKSKLMKK